MVAAVLLGLALAAGGSHGSVLLFVLTDCPIANKCMPSVNRLAEECAGKGIRFSIVVEDPAPNPSAVKRHFSDYGYRSAVTIDYGHKLARSMGATVSPEAFLLDARGRVAYRGRIDDRFPALGIERAQARREDLRLAVESMAAGKKVAVARTTAIGCALGE